MTNIKFVFWFGLLFIFACSNSETDKNKTSEIKVSEDKPKIELPSETKLLLDYLNESGDYVNSRNFPSLIKASIVFEELDKKNLVIDIRKQELFKKGHIKGAVNVDFSNIPEYFESKIKPFEYKRIIIVDNTGQYASYSTCLLRLMGYGNVFAMRWGMSGWNKETATANWLKGVSSKYDSNLEKTDIPKPAVGSFPELSTSLASGEEILQSRIKKLFEAGLEKTMLSADSVFNDPSKYFIINFDRKDKYESGHIPGAIRYKPSGTLGIVDEMATIPADKNVVIYCGTGHNSGFVTAYLDLFGYTAQTLNFGNNSFMYDRLIKEKEALSWVPFTESDIANYPVVK